jgi:hypothetical protein
MPDLYDIVDAGFERAQDAGDATVMWRFRLPDGREAAVKDACLCVGEPGEVDAADGYAYATPMSAVLAAARWIEDDCRREPEGWTKHLATGRHRFGGAPRAGETVWVCPRHPDRLPKLSGGRMFCVLCGRHLADAIEVPWPPPDVRA